ncbi:hypothetical protein [Pseudonocardia oroxyli]|uniref:Uncharacterized protein n=1 Tax=Pseudonocardia oroxyli TaxID=366584 RepID=A0A1G7JF33_PSEOR|nr:hypothetical protein [Pseudonocardia oroxyli]SDF23404.1 hypothetical protein SAMN05216377_10431 [Pseudonocardia oroxyli]
MRSAFAHTAELDLAPGSDETAPGAAIDLEVRPVAVLHTEAGRCGDRMRLRVLFACDVDLEDEVRRRIDLALASRWSVRDALPGAVRECERAEAERLLNA